MNDLDRLRYKWLTRHNGEYCTANWTDHMKEIYKYIGLHSNYSERGFGLVDFIITNLQNLYISTTAGMVMNKYNKTPIDQDYVEKLLFVNKNREFYRDQEYADKDAQDQANKESNQLNKQKEKVKAIKEIKTLLSYFHLRLVTDEEELDVMIDQ